MNSDLPPLRILGCLIKDMAPPEVIAERFRANTATAEEAGDALAAWGRWLNASGYGITVDGAA